MYMLTLYAHIALGALSISTVVAAIFLKNSRSLVGKSASFFGATLGSGVCLMVMMPTTFGRACASLTAYGLLYAALYYYVERRNTLAIQKASN